MRNIKKVTIVLKPSFLNESEKILYNLCTWMLKRKISVQFLNRQKEKISKNLLLNTKIVEDKNIYSSSDLIITLGGDGTLIGIARKCPKKSPPIFSVNMGTLGFITEFSKTEYIDHLEKVIYGNFACEKIKLFKVEVRNYSKKRFVGYFINDAVIGKNDISRMCSLSINEKDENIYSLRGDGLIISSPLGSTAYSLSAGGPVVHKSVKSIILTPICAYSISQRPLVLSENSIINIKVPNNSSSIILTLDGQEVISIDPKEVITITSSKNHYINIIKNNNKTYLYNLKKKFNN